MAEEALAPALARVKIATSALAAATIAAIGIAATTTDVVREDAATGVWAGFLALAVVRIVRSLKERL